jgi:hypothetical protein
MVELFGKQYYIDLDGITERCKTGNTIKEEGEEDTLEVNIFKYEVIKMCLSTVLSEAEEMDEEIAPFSQNGTSIAFKIAFNTLIKNNILVEQEQENEDDE